jgi:SAM-dependent methyltransferase
MRRREDAFGLALLAYLRGEGDAAEIVERDDGFLEGMPVGEWYFSPYRRWPAVERAALREARGRVLDIGCGAGRHALHLQARGLDVTGIDISPLAIRVARHRGLRRARVLPIEAIDRLPEGAFDTVLLLGNNLGLLRSRAKAPPILRRLHRLTADGGRVIAGTSDPYRTTNPAHLAYHRRNRRRGRMGGQIRMRVRYEATATRWFDYLFVSRPELRGLLRGTGWRVRRILGSGGAPYVAILERV